MITQLGSTSARDVVRASALAVFLAMVSPVAIAAAQPSDAQVRRDVRAPGQLSLELLPARNRPTLLRPGAWEFLRAVVVTRHSELPGIDVEITGLAQYSSPNGRSWRYDRFLVTTNRYIGIPDPTAPEIDALIRASPADLYQGLAPSLLGMPASGPVLAPDATFNWHTPNSVTFPMVVEIDYATQVADAVHVARVRGTYDVRIYRDAVDGPWRSYSASLRGELEELRGRDLPQSILECATTIVEIGRGVTPIRSVDECAGEIERAAGALASRAGSAEERAAFRVSAQPSGPVRPQTLAFRNFTGAVDAVHQALLTADRASLEALLRAVVADRYLAAPGILNEAGIDLVSRALFEVFSARGSYRTQFCRPLRYDAARSPPNGLMLVGTIEGTTALISVDDMGSSWRLSRLDITARHDDEGIALASARSCPAR